jgi:hypothetical protein
MTFKNSMMRVVIAAALLGCAVPACDDSNDNPMPGGAAGSGAAGKGGKGGSGGAAAASGKGGSGATGGSGGSGGASGKGGSGGSSGKGGSGGSAGAAGSDCKGATDCFCSTPTTNEEFLNHCTEATCNPFDNSKLTKIKDGKLPAIP